MWTSHIQTYIHIRMENEAEKTPKPRMVTFMIDESIRDELQALADTDDRSLSFMLRLATVQYLRRRGVDL